MRHHRREGRVQVRVCHPDATGARQRHAQRPAADDERTLGHLSLKHCSDGDTHNGAYEHTCTDRDTGCDFDADTGADRDEDADTGADRDEDADTDADKDAYADADADADADAYTNANADADANCDAVGRWLPLGVLRRQVALGLLTPCWHDTATIAEQERRGLVYQSPSLLPIQNGRCTRLDPRDAEAHLAPVDVVVFGVTAV